MAATATAPESGAEAAGGRAGAGRGRLARHGAVQRRRRSGAGFPQEPRGRVALSATGSWLRWLRECQGLGAPPLRPRLTGLRASFSKAGGFAEHNSSSWQYHLRPIYPTSSKALKCQRCQDLHLMSRVAPHL